jgi:hypothetical protein
MLLKRRRSSSWLIQKGHDANLNIVFVRRSRAVHLMISPAIKPRELELPWP